VLPVRSARETTFVGDSTKITQLMNFHSFYESSVTAIGRKHILYIHKEQTVSDIETIYEACSSREVYR
jgi:hypothetical protein